jgi:hypothetical protein
MRLVTGWGAGIWSSWRTVPAVVGVGPVPAPYHEHVGVKIYGALGLSASRPG